MDFLKIARMDANDLKLAVVGLGEMLQTDRDVTLRLIRERAGELGCSDQIEELVRAVYSSPLMGHSLPIWEKPEALSAPPPPPFDTKWLPGVFGEYAAALSEFNQVPPDLPGMLLLGAVNAATLGLHCVRAAWDEPMQLFICISMNPSERKSPVFSAVRRPIDEYEAEENKRRAPLITESRTVRASLERRLRKAIDSGEEAEAVCVAHELDALSGVKPLQLIAADATPEAVVQIMQENGGRIVLMDSEGDMFDTMAGRYSNGTANLNVYLHGYSGEKVMVNRVGRDAVCIPSATMAAVLAVQPSVVRGVFENPAMLSRGLAARFLWVQPPSMMGKRRIDVQPINDSLYAKYDDHIRRMLAKPRPQSPVPLTLTPEALSAFNEWRREVELLLGEEWKPLALWGWGGKLCGLTLRIAGTLAMMKDAQEVDAHSLLTAVAISRWAVLHAQAVSFDVRSGDSLAQRVLDKVRNKGYGAFSRRDIQRDVQGQSVFKTGGGFDGRKLDEALRELEERGYIRRQASGDWCVSPYVNPDVVPCYEEVEAL